MNIKCKTCGSSNVVVACDRIMSPNDGCVFLCLKRRAAFMESTTTESIRANGNHCAEAPCGSEDIQN